MTKIEWTRNEDGSEGKSWNPCTGCDAIAIGCLHCWANRMSKRLAGRAGYPPAPDNFKVTLHPDKLDQPLHWRKPTKIFVCSMSDLFHEDVPREFIKCVYGVTLDCPQHTFMILTKRPERMCEFSKDMSGWAPNVRLGVSVSTQEDADRNIPWLLKTPAAVRFVSAEPLLGAIDFTNIRDVNHFPYLIRKDVLSGKEIHEDDDYQWLTMEKLNQIIIGCESGPGRRPMRLDWAYDIVRQCKEAGCKVFVKQIEINGKVEHAPANFPEGLRVREE